jgi:hypothetical protein
MQQWPLAGSQAAPAPTVKQPDAASKARVKLLFFAPPSGTELPQAEAGLPAARGLGLQAEGAGGGQVR